MAGIFARCLVHRSFCVGSARGLCRQKVLSSGATSGRPRQSVLVLCGIRFLGARCHDGRRNKMRGHSEGTGMSQTAPATAR
eukprot:2827738-Pyramimonas_sp.AAC.1